MRKDITINELNNGGCKYQHKKHSTFIRKSSFSRITTFLFAVAFSETNSKSARKTKISVTLCLTVILTPEMSKKCKNILYQELGIIMILCYY